MFNTPHSRSVAKDIETGTELLEGELLCGRNMKNPNVYKGYLFTHKVDTKLDVLRLAMMNGFVRKVHTGDIVTVDNRGLGDIMMQLLN